MHINRRQVARYNENRAMSTSKINRNSYRYCYPFHVKPLGESLACVPMVVTWYLDAWGKLRPGQEPKYTTDLLNTRLSIENLPMAYVVFDENNQDKPIGTFTLTHNMVGIGDPNIVMFNNLYVANEYRGKGVAKLIVQIAENIAKKEHGLEVLQLGVTELGLQKYYARLGWLHSGEATLNGHKVIFMQKKLEAVDVGSQLFKAKL